MHRRALFLLSFIGLLLAGCQGGMPPTLLVMEVTREVPVTVPVTVIVTADSTIGPIPLVSPTPSSTPQGTPYYTPTPSPSPTPDIFPTPVVGQVYVADQLFERGRMFWVQPVNQIWVLSVGTDGKQTWAVYRDSFTDEMPEIDSAIVAPSGFYQPERGFGLLWRDNPDVRAALGWALQPELGYQTRYEYHAGGSISNNQYLAAPGYHLIETLDREEYRLNEGIWTWEVKKAG